MNYLCENETSSQVESQRGSIIEPHGRGVPEAILHGRSPRPGLPKCGRSPHLGRPGRGEQPLSMAEGTPCRVVLFLLYPFSREVLFLLYPLDSFGRCAGRTALRGEWGECRPGANTRAYNAEGIGTSV